MSAWLIVIPLLSNSFLILSKKENIKNEDLTLIEGFKILKEKQELIIDNIYLNI